MSPSPQGDDPGNEARSGVRHIIPQTPTPPFVPPVFLADRRTWERYPRDTSFCVLSEANQKDNIFVDILGAEDVGLNLADVSGSAINFTPHDFPKATPLYHRGSC